MRKKEVRMKGEGKGRRIGWRLRERVKEEGEGIGKTLRVEREDERWGWRERIGGESEGRSWRERVKGLGEVKRTMLRYKFTEKEYIISFV